MKAELKKIILEWKNEQVISGEREVIKMKTSLKDNEYLLIMKQTVRVSFNGKTQIVSSSKYFQTQAQNDPNFNPAGDLINFERVKQNLENDFENKFQKAVDELLSDRTEEPFN